MTSEKSNRKVKNHRLERRLRKWGREGIEKNGKDKGKLEGEVVRGLR